MEAEGCPHSRRTAFFGLMCQQGFSQAELARRSGLSKSSVSRYLSGERTPGAPAALALSRALGVSLGELLETFEIR